MISFSVYGVPAPQGSKTAVRNKSGRVVGSRESSKAVGPWRQELAAAAQKEAEVYGCLDGPLTLDVVFRFSMPKSARKADRLRGWAPKSTLPDADKLLRAAGDALKAGGLIRDDARFSDIRVRKIDVWEQWTGALIRVGQITHVGETLDSLEPHGGLFEPEARPLGLMFDDPLTSAQTATRATGPLTGGFRP